MRSMLLLFFLLTILNADDTKKVEFGILYEKIFLTKKSAEVAKKIWTKHVGDELTKNTYIEFYTNEDLIIKKYLNDSSMGLILIHPSLYYKNKKSIDEGTKSKWVPVINRDSTFQQYYLVKNKESSLNLSNLHRANIIYEDNVSKLWLEYFLMKKYKKSFSKLIKKAKGTKKSSKLLFDIFFSKKTVSIVPKAIYDDMINMNPQIKKRVEILAKSEEIFVKALGFSSEHLSKEKHDVLIKTSEDINNKGNAFEMFRFVNLHKIVRLEEDALKNLDKFFEEYFYLKEKYK